MLQRIFHKGDIMPERSQKIVSGRTHKPCLTFTAIGKFLIKEHPSPGSVIIYDIIRLRDNNIKRVPCLCQARSIRFVREKTIRCGSLFIIIITIYIIPTCIGHPHHTSALKLIPRFHIKIGCRQPQLVIRSKRIIHFFLVAGSHL